MAEAAGAPRRPQEGPQREVSASLLARYVHLDCDVFLRRSSGAPWPAADDPARAADAADAASAPGTGTELVAEVPAALHAEDDSERAWREALLQRGRDYERELQALQLGDENVSAFHGRTGRQVRDPWEVLLEAARALRGAPADHVALVYEWTVPTARANELWPLPPTTPADGGGGTGTPRIPVLWRTLEADVLRCQRKPAPDAEAAAAAGTFTVRITVADIKASATLKLYHQVQVALYAKMLERLLAQQQQQQQQALAAHDGATGRAVAFTLDDHGEVWRPGQSRPDRFLLAPLSGHLEALLQEKVPRALATDAVVPWNVLARCSECEYKSDCRQRAQQQPRPGLNLVAGMASADVAWIRAQLNMPDRRRATIDVEDLAQDRVVQRLYNDEPARARRALALRPAAVTSAVLDAARTRQAQLRGVPDPSLPVTEDVAVFLTLVADPSTGAPIVFGVRVIDRTRRSEGGLPTVLLATTLTLPSITQPGGHPDAALLEAQRMVVTNVAAVLRLLAQGEPRTVQFYVWDEAERTRIVDALLGVALSSGDPANLNAGDDDDDTDAAMRAALALVDDDPRTAVAGEHTQGQHGSMAPPRLLALASAVSRLCVVPKPGFFTLPEALEVLPAVPLAASAAAVPTEDLVHVTDADLFAAYRLHTADTPVVEARIRGRLGALERLLDRVRHLAAPPAGHARAGGPARALLPLPARPLHPVAPSRMTQPNLRRLRFMAMYARAAEATERQQERLTRTGRFIVVRPPPSSWAATNPWTLAAARAEATRAGAAPQGQDAAANHNPPDASSWWTVTAGAEHVDADNFLATADNAAGADAARVLGNWFMVSLPNTYFADNGDDIDAYVAAPDTLNDVKANYHDLEYANKPYGLHLLANERRSAPPLWVCNIAEAQWSIDTQQGRVLRVRLVWADRVTGPSNNVQRDHRRFLLRPRMVDFNTDKMCECLQTLDDANADTSAPLLLLQAPQTGLYDRVPSMGSNRNDRADDDDVRAIYNFYRDREHAEAYQLSGVPGMRLSVEQQEVYEQLRNHGLLVLWGPPGTGKTTFLAGAIVRLLHLAHAKKQPLAVWITAFTKAAAWLLVQRVLVLVQALARQVPADAREPWRLPRDGQPPLLRDVDDVVRLEATVQDGEVNRALDGVGERYLVVGTPWQLHKHRKRLARQVAQRPNGVDAKRLTKLSFDLTIVDEASQMNVATALVALQGARGPGGRIVLAGDPMQLPPIQKSAFPVVHAAPAPGQRYGARLDGSVLQCVLRNPVSGQPLALEDLLARRSLPPYVHMLTKTHRCNRAITHWAQVVYGPNFSNVSERVLRRSPASQPAAATSPTTATVRQLPLYLALTDLLLQQQGAAAAALISVKLSESAETALQALPLASQLAVEARLVATVVCWLRDHAELPFEGGSPAVFVATPHRAQRAAVLADLGATDSEANAARSGFYEVDTVERLQGREADVVVAAYLFADPTRVGQEKDFVFNLQRLNVTLTRARILCVVLASSAIHTPSLAMLGDPVLQPALALFRAFFAQATQVTVDTLPLP
jgi:hypothetical protein